MLLKCLPNRCSVIITFAICVCHGTTVTRRNDGDLVTNSTFCRKCSCGNELKTFTAVENICINKNYDAHCKFNVKGYTLDIPMIDDTVGNNVFLMEMPLWKFTDGEKQDWMISIITTKIEFHDEIYKTISFSTEDGKIRAMFNSVWPGLLITVHLRSIENISYGVPNLLPSNFCAIFKYAGTVSYPVNLNALVPIPIAVTKPTNSTTSLETTPTAASDNDNINIILIVSIAATVTILVVTVAMIYVCKIRRKKRSRNLSYASSGKLNEISDHVYADPSDVVRLSALNRAEEDRQLLQSVGRARPSTGNADWSKSSPQICDRNHAPLIFSSTENNDSIYSEPFDDNRIPVDIEGWYELPASTDNYAGYEIRPPTSADYTKLHKPSMDATVEYFVFENTSDCEDDNKVQASATHTSDLCENTYEIPTCRDGTPLKK